ncbi:putative E3 ubiquitin-protein ligase LIN-1 [Salvia hispanica]|uniref:putative E3 ubiquitin-protein ligase LIN-1 n=1 Tax=Salvia hispanica TaxID=49212 RepID=UPI002009D577|nr:putative E3 ubiquitin-protein ligase LIN-1 [Salvia hispanica]
MVGNYRFRMEENDIVGSLISSVGSFIQDRLIDREQRLRHKEQCAERLAAENASPHNDTEVRYSDQAVLANLDWGIDALEEAISTSNTETKMARLDYAEKMLQVCALLNSTQKTAGVPNSYLSAWAHLNLSYLFKLRNEGHSAVLHVLEMFVVDPFFSRIDFAPELWKSIFLPHMNSILGWYTEERKRIVMDVIPDASDLSFTVDFDHCFDESLLLSVRPEQAERIQELEQLYGQSLDENTRLYAKHYKECMNYDAATSRRVIPMLPIAEPPVTPLRDFSSRSIPDYVKFGPILPKSAGFATTSLPIRTMAVSTLGNAEESATWDVVDENPEECEDSGEDSDGCLGAMESSKEKDDDIVSVLSSRSNRSSSKEVERQSLRGTSRRQSPHNSSPAGSPCSRTSSPKSARSTGTMQTSMLRLLSTRAMDSNISPSDTDEETTEQFKSPRRSTHHVPYALPKSSLNQGEDCSLSYISSPLTPKSRPPKDFVCPITGQIFNDPVTLETGQTYERKAIQEWMSRGNTTCPITRQPLSAASLPKTNYVLKRLITSWKDQHPELAREFSSLETPQNFYTSSTFHNDIPSTLPTSGAEYKPQRFTTAAATTLSTSPTSVISQTSNEAVITALKPYILCICNSEDLQECEAAVLEIVKIWSESNVGSGIHSYLSSPTIVNGFLEILSASTNKDVLKTTIYILSQLICADDHVGDLLMSIDSDFYCLADLLRKGLSEAAILVYLLRPSFSQLSSHNLVTTLLHIVSKKSEDHVGFQYAVAPKDAAVALLEQIVSGGDESERSQNAMIVIKENGIPALLSCLNRADGRESIVSILLCCIRIDTSCKSIVASKIELSPILELFHGGNDSVRGICIEFLCELVQMRRRTFSNQILQIIRDEGTFSTMHTLLVYLQMSPMVQKPAIATLLLQLDLLAAPRKMSIYREEAMEALLEALQRKDFPSSQVMALGTLSSLSGHFGGSRKAYMECWLLKVAGFDQPYNAMMRGEETKTDEEEFAEMREEEKATRNWEKRMAFVLANHEKGLIFKALEECLVSNSIEIAKSSLVVATWLVYMLYSFPDCGIRDVARKCLLEKFISVLQSSKNLEEKILAALALRGFVTEPRGQNEMGAYAKSMWKTLRRLKKSCTVVHDIMKALMNLPYMDAAELWCCVEGPELDMSMNGEILSMLHIRNRLISSHSDGTIKVWDTGKRAPRLIQEAREHTKAVTCLYVPPSCDKLYSGSLDKTIRVWTIRQEEIHCIQVHDVKEGVVALAANASVACFSSQGNGVKVYNWSGISKNISFNNKVKCMKLEGDKLYCGCSGYSVQEVDLKTHTSSSFYSGAKKILGKQTIYSLQIQDGLLYASGSSVDGIAGKVFKLSNKAVVGSLATGVDVQQCSVNNDFIFTATKCGIIEVWLKERITKIAYIKMDVGHGRITSIVSDAHGQKLFAGTSDGRLQIWSLE